MVTLKMVVNLVCLVGVLLLGVVGFFGVVLDRTGPQNQAAAACFVAMLILILLGANWCICQAVATVQQAERDRLLRESDRRMQDMRARMDKQQGNAATLPASEWVGDKPTRSRRNLTGGGL